ncbi:MAG: hypothetical protein IKG18_17495 [Atopobiaceae bacterium]|nr:hypothetical protein [Atopobiaceae bacterium]
MPRQSTPNERERQSNEENLDMIGDLLIRSRDSDAEIRVPLRRASEVNPRTRGALDLYDDDVVWEDTKYALSFSVQSTEPIRRATVSVNDHTELWMHSSFSDMYLGGQHMYHYVFEVDPSKGNVGARLPFALTCGFARVEARIEFMRGPDVLLVTPDIVSLDEPRTGDPEGEDAEEINVSGMYEALIEPDRNQAAEWMFSTGFTMVPGAQLSADEHTDWAYAPIALRLRVGSDALDLIYDGLENEGDAFPNVANDVSCVGPYDTFENRAVRALVSSMETQVRSTREQLESMLRETRLLYGRIQKLVAHAGVLRGRDQSLPATIMLSSRVDHEQQLFRDALDLHERITEALAALDDAVEGIGEVQRVPFHVPPKEGLFVHDSTYARLHEAMDIWARCAYEPVERMDLTLHTIKPDKLFEYSALHRMLTWLYLNGFRENTRHPHPIDRYHYSLEDTYDKFENERRCANTYHLIRPDGTSPSTGTSIDLYYQPVLYADERNENGISLHRLVSENETVNRHAFWTPDFMIRVNHKSRISTYLLDAKYCRGSLLDEKLGECVIKYWSKTSASPHDSPGVGVTGVVLLAGKLDAPRLTVMPAGEGRPLRIIAPFNKNTGARKMSQFFAKLGISALASR